MYTVLWIEAEEMGQEKRGYGLVIDDNDKPYLKTLEECQAIIEERYTGQLSRYDYQAVEVIDDNWFDGEVGWENCDVLSDLDDDKDYGYDNYINRVLREGGKLPVDLPEGRGVWLVNLTI